MSLTLVTQLLGRARFLRDRGEVKSPQLMEEAADHILTSENVLSFTPHRTVRLKHCRPGLFLSENGTLCFRNEYTTDKGWPEAYVVSSGEFFWGGTNSHEDRLNLLVTPIEIDGDYV